MAVGQLNLTEDQKAALREILAAQREAGATTREQMRQAQQQLAAAVFTDAPDDNAVAAAVVKVQDLQAQAMQADITIQQRVNALLTPEQRQQLLTLLARPPRGPRPPQPPPQQ